MLFCYYQPLIRDSLLVVSIAVALLVLFLRKCPNAEFPNDSNARRKSTRSYSAKAVFDSFLERKSTRFQNARSSDINDLGDSFLERRHKLRGLFTSLAGVDQRYDQRYGLVTADRVGSLP